MKSAEPIRDEELGRYELRPIFYKHQRKKWYRRFDIGRVSENRFHVVESAPGEATKEYVVSAAELREGIARMHALVYTHLPAPRPRRTRGAARTAAAEVS